MLKLLQYTINQVISVSTVNVISIVSIVKIVEEEDGIKRDNCGQVCLPSLHDINGNL